jgi:ABC-type sulfate transport system substrate-binding protein
VEKMKLQSDNKFELILEIAEEANDFLLDNPDESIVKRPVLKVISDRVNESSSRDVADAYLDATFEFLEDLGKFNLN